MYLLWQGLMDWFHVACLSRCGFVKGLLVFIVVFCVRTLCVGTISRFLFPHSYLPDQLFELETFRITISVGQHFPPLLIGCCKVTLKTFHLFHLPACLAEILTRWTPAKTTLLTSYFHLQLTFFYTIKPFSYGPLVLSSLTFLLPVLSFARVT